MRLVRYGMTLFLRDVAAVPADRDSSMEFGRDETSLAIGSDVAILKESGGFGWNGVYAALTQERPHVAVHRAIPDIWLASTLTGVDLGRSSGGSRKHGTLPGGLTSILPPDESVRDEIGQPVTAMHVFLRANVLREVADEMFPGHRADRAVLPVFATRDPVLALFIDAIRMSLNEPAGSNTLKIEYLQRAMAAHLLQHHSADGHVQHRSTREGLSPRQLRRVSNYIDENLDAPLQLNELAAVAGVSRTQFIRRFATSTRMTPHRYVVEARIRKAKTLLSDRRLPLTDVAYMCGFSSHAHFSTVFRRLTGVSPATWRQVTG